MKMNPWRVSRRLASMAALLLLATAASAAEPVVTEQIEPAEIALGQSAQLTIAASGANATQITPPVIPGLEFAAVGQTSQIESINGRTTSTSSVVYQVTPQRVGIYTIPGITQRSQPQVLTVVPGSARSGAALTNNAAASALPPAAQLAQDASAFVRLRLPKHQPYVGESMPVDIQVGMREGLVASLNGLPTLNGDSFTLNKLSTQPDRTDEVIGGQPFTVLTWHSVLAAVKPGVLSLTIETPLTVRMQATRPAPEDQSEDSALNIFNDPFFQNFFGGTTEKDITVTSTPAAFNVLALPYQNRPAGFSGAVGTFKISSDVSAATTTAGDPLTLRLHVTGAGNFDRVNSAMLSGVEHWKTYPPAASFTPADSAGYRGQKIFEQPVIAAQSGTQTLPGLAFSYFDPDTRRYETLQTPPLSVAVAPAALDSTNANATPTIAGAAAVVEPPRGGLRPHHIETGESLTSLRPEYFQPRYLSIPSVLTLAFTGAWFWMRRREQVTDDRDAQKLETTTTATMLAQMDRAAATGDAVLFFNSARSTVQRSLATRWQVPPEKITLEDIDSRLGADRGNVRRLFALADEAAYSGCTLKTTDSQMWRRVVLRQVEERAPS
jgi:hypothetical protein